MGAYDKVLKAASDVAKRLETQLQREFKKGNYSALQGLAKELESAQELVKHIAKLEGGGRKPAAVQAPAKQAKTAEAEAPKKRRRSSPKKGYPKFERQENNLVKVEWNNANNGEARHRVSYGTMSLLAQAISKSTGDSFKKTLLDGASAADGKQVPNHQIHAILLWLQSIKAITKKGRGDYYPNLNKLSPASLKASFDQTPEAKKAV